MTKQIVESRREIRKKSAVINNILADIVGKCVLHQKITEGIHH